MTRMPCDAVQDSAAEFALGLLDGVERARIAEHLDSCSSCRRHVEDLTAGVDVLLLAAPVTEPPAGFEERVACAAVVDQSRARRQPALRWVAAAAAVALVVLGIGVVIGRAVGRAPEAAVRSTAMRTPDGRVVGRVAVGADPDTVFVALPGWRPPDEGHRETYRLRITLAGGGSQVVGPVHLESGDGSWGTVLPVDAHQVRGVSLVGEQGHAYCVGSLS